MELMELCSVCDSMREIEKLFKLSEVTDKVIEWVESGKLSPWGATIIVEAIESGEIKVTQRGEIEIPFEVLKKLF